MAALPRKTDDSKSSSSHRYPIERGGNHRCCHPKLCPQDSTAYSWVAAPGIAVCLLLLAMADRRKRTFRWDHRLQIANSKTHEKNARKSARAERLHYCCTAVLCPWLPLFYRLPLSAYCCLPTAPSLQPLLHPCMICEEKIKCRGLSRVATTVAAQACDALCRMCTHAATNLIKYVIMCEKMTRTRLMIKVVRKRVSFCDTHCVTKRYKKNHV